MKNFTLEIHNGWSEIIFNNSKDDSISEKTILDLNEIITHTLTQDTLKAVILRGIDGGFHSRGLKIQDLRSMKRPEFANLVTASNTTLTRISSSQIPIICVVDGECFGAGLEFILACHMRISTPQSKFAAPESVFGLIPGGGAIQRISRTAGPAQAYRLVSTGITIDAAEALRIGLIEEVVLRDRLAKRWKQLGKRLAKIPSQAITSIHQAIAFGENNGLAAAIDNDLSILINHLTSVEAG